jgi:trehalose-6-phosphate synthase
MPVAEQAARMRTMRANVAEFNSYWWAGQMLQDGAAQRRQPVSAILRPARELIRIVREDRVDAERVQKM